MRALHGAAAGSGKKLFFFFSFFHPSGVGFLTTNILIQSDAQPSSALSKLPKVCKPVAHVLDSGAVAGCACEPSLVPRARSERELALSLFQGCVESRPSPQPLPISQMKHFQIPNSRIYESVSSLGICSSLLGHIGLGRFVSKARVTALGKSNIFLESTNVKSVSFWLKKNKSKCIRVLKVPSSKGCLLLE